MICALEFVVVESLCKETSVYRTFSITFSCLFLQLLPFLQFSVLLFPTPLKLQHFTKKNT